MQATIVAPKIVAVLTLTALALWFGTLARGPAKDGSVSIVRLELAPTVEPQIPFLRAWEISRPRTWHGDLSRAQQWDTWFISAYAPLFTLLCWIAADHFARASPILGTVGHVLAVAQLLAGALNFVENVAMQTMIDRGFAITPWPQISSSASGIKWFLLLAFIVYVCSAVVHVAVWAVALGHSKPVILRMPAALTLRC
jgi:hypothetical protein